MEETNIKNPHGLCTWEGTKHCDGCGLNGRLHCHLDKKYAIMFGIPFFAFAVAALSGIIMVGFPANVITLAAWFGYMIFFFVAWEPRMLCSHCPFYAEGNTNTLHCSINYGFRKTAKYNPYPLTRSEKAQFVIGANIMLAIPLIVLAWGQQWLALVFSIAGIVTWYIVLQTKICVDCVNFSCPFNKVDKETRDAFLKRNPVMLDAWKERGYEIN